jgi:fucose permease
MRLQCAAWSLRARERTLRRSSDGSLARGLSASILIVSASSFLALGLITAAIGPALPELAANTSSDLAAIGGLFSALFFGALLAQLLAGPLIDRFGERPLLIAGFILVGLGMFGVLGSRQLGLALASGVFLGLGHGVVDVSTNIMIAGVFARRRAAALNLLNLFFGLGAFIGPALAGLCLERSGTALPVLGLGGVLFLALTPLVSMTATRSRIPYPEAPAPIPRHIYRSALLWILGLLLLIYVGVETGVGGWTTTYLERSTGISTASAALVTSGFWLALTAGRIVAMVLGTRIESRPLLALGLATACLGGMCLVIGIGNSALSIVGTLVLGFGFGPVFPTTVAITTALYRRATGTATSIVIAMGSLGAMILPALQGALLERSQLASAALVAGAAFGLTACFAAYVWLYSALSAEARASL